jgi:hypothetical protein
MARTLSLVVRNLMFTVVVPGLRPTGADLLRERIDGMTGD